MTNTIAFWLGLTLVGVVAFDYFFLDYDLMIRIAQEFARLVEWVAFWR
ncbi:MAG: hypothetical protein ACJAXT_001118 [Paracoccaceae bacterium]|jgi:hypothetical protein